MGSKWSNKTVKKSLQMGFACDSTGYDLTLEGAFPLPSFKTLRRRLEGSSCSAEDVAAEVKTLIERWHSVGLQVVAVTSDMGSSNRAMWKLFGVNAGRNSRVVNLIPHPQVPGQQIAFLADVPHSIKNLNGHLGRGPTITMPSDVVAANGLTCSTVSLEPVRQFVEFQRNLTFKLAHELRPELLDLNHFEKMMVSAALRVKSHSTATALRFLVENHGWSEEFLNTA
ncbi:uncharacterized protein LOC121836592 [Ixodes scapularis]|uniref:uncharacterized protein LOC121836592 n=1 Tax=Ixodes scapularis TaxID=6945 RepID=UPI001C3825D1|nr:uncharacterized protein LOC121836592 [Ixodes scapularis]